MNTVVVVCCNKKWKNDIVLQEHESIVEEREIDPTAHLILVALLDGVEYKGSSHLKDIFLKDNSSHDKNVHNEDTSLEESLQFPSSYKGNTNVWDKY